MLSLRVPVLNCDVIVEFHSLICGLGSRLVKMSFTKFGPSLRELRIHLCQKSDASRGVRDFIEKHYVTMKKNNPKFPILIRECSGIQPVLYARHGYGKEMSVPLSGMSEDQILKKVLEISSTTAPVE